MSRFWEVFPVRHTVLPVIHVTALEQALRNTQIARDAGADGVFLINHAIQDKTLLTIQDGVADAHPDWWVGVNCLGLSPEQTFSLVSPKVSGVWADNAGIEEHQIEQNTARQISLIRQERASSSLYFGGVAFKYQRYVEDLEAACRAASRHMDVITTSGRGTGHPAEIEKIRRMKTALDCTPLAIASGVTPENVGEYLPFANAFLVASGISRSFTELDAGKVQSLVERVRSYKA